jgi:hypothetical protein
MFENQFGPNLEAIDRFHCQDFNFHIEGKGTFENVDIRMDDGGERRAGGESHEQ